MEIISHSQTRSALLVVTAAAFSAFLFGCATGTVMKWTGQSEFVGRGGAMQTKDGIDFYMSGEPAGRFRVLSIVQGLYYRGGNLLMSVLSEQSAYSKIIKEAKAEGADAVVVLSSQYQVWGSSTSGGGSGTVEGTATSFGPTTSFNGTADMSYSSTTVIHGSQNGSVALVKYIDVKR